MGMSMFAANLLLAPLQRSLAGLFVRVPRRETEASPARVARPVCAPAATPAHSRTRPPRALRVVRVLEGSQAAASAGRMVISGRMADVCAELERLAALEAAAG